MGGTTKIVVEVPSQKICGRLVTKSTQSIIHLFHRQIKIGHKHISLFSNLVRIGCLAFGLQDPVHTMDIRIFFTIFVPRKLLEAKVTIKLSNNAIIDDYM